MQIIKALLAISVLSATAACNDTAPNANDKEITANKDKAHKDNDALIANALSAGPNDVTENATVIDGEGNVIRQGSNGWTCMPESAAMGPMCNDETWMAALGAMQAGEAFPTGKFGVSYMLAGEGNAPGVSNLDPSATEPTEHNMWIKDGPHMMVILPDPASYAEIENDIANPVYVMWKDTPHAHLMVRLADAEGT